MKRGRIFIFVLFAVIFLSIELYGNKESIVYQREEPNKYIVEKNKEIITSSSSENCSLVGRALFGNARGVFVVGDTAYVAAGAAMLILDMTDKTDPAMVGYCYMDNPSLDVYAIGDYAYVADGSGGLRVIDISDRTNPIEVGYYDTDGLAYGVYIVGNYAYLADGSNGLRIIDVSDPENPTEVGYYDTESSAHDVFLVGDYAYVVDTYWDDSTSTYKGHLRIIDISDPTNPDEIGYYDTESYTRGVYVSGDYAYVANDKNGLRIIDVSDPTNPTEVEYYDTDGYVYDVYVSGDYAYVADDVEGLRIIDVSDPTNPTEVGYYDTKDYSWGVYGEGDYAYVADNADGLRIIDISDPTNPTEVGCRHTGGTALNVYVVGDYAYVAEEVDGLIIMDVSNKSNPAEIGYYDADSIVYNVYVVGDYAYLAEGYEGLRIINVSDPENPTEVGYYGTSNYAREVYVVGDYAYVVEGGDGLRILDVSDKTNPTEVGYYDTDGDARGVYVVGDYAYIADGYEGLRIIDVSDKSNPIETGYYTDSIAYTGNFAFDVYVVGDYAYIAHGKGGLKIIDISDKTNPVEVGSKSLWYAVNIYVVGDYAYVVDSGEGLKIINISDKTNPEEIGYYDTDARGVCVSDNYVYLANYSGEMYILDHIWISLIYPNGGETYYISDVDTIKWYSRDSTDKVEISYTIGNGNTWQVIDTVDNTGSYAWTIPNTPSDSCKVKVKSTEYVGVEDISNEMFAIKKKIELTTFNNGIYYVSDMDTIKWEADTLIDSIEISYTIDNGNTWQVIDTVDNTGSYAWTIPNTPSDSCLIKLQSLEYSDVNDVSDSMFKIVNRHIYLSTFNNGETHYISNIDTIKWDADESTYNIEISYTINNGSTWQVIDTVSNTGSYAWTIPDTPSDSCLIKLQSLEYSDVNDVSDSMFTIFEGSIELTTFNNGTYYATNIDTIKWTSTTNIDSIEISYTIDDGNTWILIDTVSNTGSYAWTIPNTPSDSCKIRIQSIKYSYLADESDNLFSIYTRGLNLETFNGGNVYLVGEEDTIRWGADTSTHNVEISYSTNDGNNWSVVDTTSNTGIYVWKVSDGLSDSCKVKVTSVEYPDIYDESDSLFEIRRMNFIYPVGGEIVEGGTILPIQWESYMDSVYMTINYSLDGGSNWEVINANAENDGIYDWLVPRDTTSTNAIIELVLTDGTNILQEESSGEFTIANRIELTSPNGGELVERGSVYQIEWEAIDSINFVGLYYTYDEGNNWETIVAIVRNTGMYDWSVPDTVYDSVLVKIVNTEDTTVYDISDSTFRIDNIQGIKDIALKDEYIRISGLSKEGIEIYAGISKNKEADIRVYDISGRKVKEEKIKLQRGEYKVNIPINSGVYFVVIKGEKEIIRKKVIVIK